jgi:hypothetical protein
MCATGVPHRAGADSHRTDESRAIVRLLDRIVALRSLVYIRHQRLREAIMITLELPHVTVLVGRVAPTLEVV